MSSSWSALLAVQFKSYFSSNMVGNSKKGKKRAGLIIVYLFLGIIAVFYCGLISKLYVYFNMADFIMPFILTISSCFVLLTTIYKANGFLFGAKDDDLLMSMPIPLGRIIISRFFILYIFEVAIAAVTVLPAMFVYLTDWKFSVSFLVQCIISIFIIPLIPLAIASLIGIVITYISAHTKHKNVISIILTGGAFVALMAFSMSSQSDEQIINMAAGISSVIHRIYPPVILFERGLNGEIICSVLFALISIVVAGIVIVLIALNYKRIKGLVSSVSAKGTYKINKQFKSSSQSKALLKKEAKLFFSFPSWVLNACAGYIMMIIFAVMIFAKGDISFLFDIPEFNHYIMIFIPAVLGFVISLSSMTYASISLEGKNLSLLASLPVEDKTIYRSKIIFNLCFSAPISIISGVLMIVKFNLLNVYGVMAVLIPVLYAVFVAVFGMFLNLKHVNLNWTNYTAVVKNSFPATVCTLGSMVSSIILCVLVYVLRDYAWLVYVGWAVVLLGLSILFYSVIRKTQLKKIIE